MLLSPIEMKSHRKATAGKPDQTASLAGWTKFALAVSAAAWLAEAGVAFLLADLIDQTADLAPYVETWLSTRTTVLTLSTTATGILFVWWHWNVRTTLRALGRADLEHDDRAVLGWWFVPLAFFVMPFKVMAETYRAATTPSHRKWKGTQTPLAVRKWTLGFVGGVVGTRVLAESAVGYELFGDPIVAYGFSAIVMAVAAYWAINMVTDVTDGCRNRRNETQRPRRETTEGRPSGPITPPEPRHADPVAQRVGGLWEGRISTLESLTNEGALSPEAASGRALVMMSELNAEGALDASTLASYNKRLLSVVNR